MRIVAVAGLVWLGCSGEAPERECVLNETRPCFGASGARGITTCGQTGWSACDTAPAPTAMSLPSQAAPVTPAASPAQAPAPSGQAPPTTPPPRPEPADVPAPPQPEPDDAPPAPAEMVCLPGEVALTPFGCSSTEDEFLICRTDGTGWEDRICVPAPMPGSADRECVPTQPLIGQYDVTVTREDSDLYSFTSAATTGLLQTRFCFQFVFFDLALLDVLGFGVDKLYFSSGAECDVVGVCIDE